MHYWARRGLRAALVTGGLLMLGTGIASADERVDPDAPPSPLDGGVSVPVKVGNFSLGTPLGTGQVPVVVDETVSTGDGLAEGSAPFAPYFKRNVVAPNALAPVEATGWAVAAGGDAAVVNESTEAHSQGGDVVTSGSGDSLAGNVVAPTAVVPVQATGIAFPLLGTASVVNDTDQESTAGGSVITDGDNSALSGNILAPHVAAPVGVNNTAAGWFAGIATVAGNSRQAAFAPGTRETTGDDSVGSGNVGSAPVALPAQVDGTAASWGGIATTVSENTAVAEAGTAGSGLRGAGDPYTTTSGDSAVLSGNALTPQGAGIAAVNCTAGSWVGISTTECTNDLSSEAGGDVATSGTDSMGSGNIVDADPSTPVTVLDTAGAWGGMATAQGTDVVATEAGGTTATDGDDSVLGGNVVGAPVAAPAQVNGTAGTWIGDVESVTDNTTVAEAGNAAEADGHDSQWVPGYATTSGDDSAGGGNIVTAQAAPLAAVDCTSGVWGGMSSTTCATDETAEAGGNDVTSGSESLLGGNIVDGDAAVPATAYDNAGAWIGMSDATGDNVTLTDAGGRGDTDGTDSVGGGNTVRPMLATPVELQCVAGVWGGTSETDCTTDSTADAGSNTHTYGDDATVGGNMVDAPVAGVTQVAEISGAWIGDSAAAGDNTSVADAGAGSYTTGDSATLSGNQASAPVSFAADALCSAGTWVGEADSACTNSETVTTGEYTGTTGNESVGSGNIVSTPLAPIAEVFGVAGAWGGDVSAASAEDKVVTAGGNNNTQDDYGTLSSNVVTAPWAPSAQVSNLAAAWIGNPTSVVDSATTSSAGGDNFAAGTAGTGSGNIVQAPAALPADVHTVAATWGGNALATGTHSTDSTAGGDSVAHGESGALSGNIVSGGGAGAANVFGGALSWVGNNAATSDKTLTATGGGDTTSHGEQSSLSGNQVLANANPVAQVFGVAGSFVANDANTTDADTMVTSAGDATASGAGGAGSGSVVDADAQPLAQVFGINAAALGATVNDVSQTTDVVNGGDIVADGTGGAFSGDVVDADAQAPWQVFGIDAAALGLPVNTVDHGTTAINGGDTKTSGAGGSLAGDVVNADAQGPAQVFGMDAAAAGVTANTVSDSLSATNGGQSTTSGTGGSLAGDIVSAEAQALPQVFGWGVSALGTSTQTTGADTSALNGGDLTTAGSGNFLAGDILDVPVTADPGAFGWAASAFGIANNTTANSLAAGNGGTATSTGGTAMQIPVGLASQLTDVTIPIAATIVNSVTNGSAVQVANEPVTVLSTDGLMAADALPAAPMARAGRSPSALPGMPADVPVRASLPTVDQGLTAVPATGAFSGELPLTTDLPTQRPALSDLDTMEMLRVPGGTASR